MWELWDVESGNIVNTYPNEQAALAVVREAVIRHGPTYVENWALGRDDNDDPDTVIEGDLLVARAMKRLSPSG